MQQMFNLLLGIWSDFGMVAHLVCDITKGNIQRLFVCCALSKARKRCFFLNLDVNQLRDLSLTVLLENTTEENSASLGPFKSSAVDTHPNVTGAVRGHVGRVSRTPGRAKTPTPTVEGDLKGRRSGFNLRNAAQPYFTRRCCLTLSW